MPEYTIDVDLHLFLLFVVMNSIIVPTVNFEKYLNITQDKRKIINLSPSQ